MNEAAPLHANDDIARSAKLADLPPPNTRRWVIRRKAAVVAAVAAGTLTTEEACARYLLSPEELESWRRAIDQHGLRGLRTTRIQEYRARDRVAAAPSVAESKYAAESGVRPAVHDDALV